MKMNGRHPTYYEMFVSFVEPESGASLIWTSIGVPTESDRPLRLSLLPASIQTHGKKKEGRRRG